MYIIIRRGDKVAERNGTTQGYRLKHEEIDEVSVINIVLKSTIPLLVINNTPICDLKDIYDIAIYEEKPDFKEL